MYQHKEYSVGFEVDKGTGTALPKFIKHVEIIQRCLLHSMFYALDSNRYRKYRRGKNRCLRCGVKLK